MGGGDTPGPPEFSQQEQAFQASGANLVNLQRDLLLQQQQQAAALEEVALRQSGLERYSLGAAPDPHAEQRAQIRAHAERVRASLNAGRNPNTGEKLSAKAIEGWRRDIAALEASIPSAPTGERFEFRETEALKQQREREKQREEKRFAVEELALERQGRALRGELPIDQGLLKDLGKREQTLRDTLRANIGTGFETSTAGIQALQEFEQVRQATLDAARRGDIEGLTPLSFDGGPNISFGPPETFLGLQTPFAGQFGQAAERYRGLQEPYQRQRELLYQSQLANAQKSNLFGDIFGGIVGTGLGFATGGLGTAFGTAIGTGLGNKFYPTTPKK